jgi:hypothetical protein
VGLCLTVQRVGDDPSIPTGTARKTAAALIEAADSSTDAPPDVIGEPARWGWQPISFCLAL